MTELLERPVETPVVEKPIVVVPPPLPVAPTFNERLVEVLREARSRVAYGWLRGAAYGMSNGRRHVCAQQAILDSTEDDYLRSRALTQLIDTVNMRYQYVYRYDSIPDWNDQAERTKEEVLAAYDQTIARLKG